MRGAVTNLGKPRAQLHFSTPASIATLDTRGVCPHPPMIFDSVPPEASGCDIASALSIAGRINPSAVALAVRLAGWRARYNWDISQRLLV